jgi:4-phospho-D-threonate 3-dehydrogenase / 4-phospho-D-erythronate 3-dehydrogenase
MTPPGTPVGITMGDPSGIGPEIIVKALAGSAPPPLPCIVIGDPLVMTMALKAHAPDWRLRVLGGAGETCPEPGTIELLPSSALAELPAPGQISAASGEAAYDAVVKAIGLARQSAIAGIVTAPIHKEAFAAAGIAYPGHTEILAEHSGGARVAMMLANDEIRTVLVTIHCALREAIDRADFPAQMSAIRLADEGARALGIASPRVAVAGLNPHAGEGGLFGSEETEIIAPAIEAARREGIDASGPWPGDTVFMQARQGRFDVVVAQYHDQGLIPVKYLGLEKGVNITLGLPFVRTSPDHGTAFDIAGRGIADPASLKTALAYAAQLIAAGRKGRA